MQRRFAICWTTANWIDKRASLTSKLKHVFTIISRHGRYVACFHCEIRILMGWTLHIMGRSDPACLFVMFRRMSIHFSHRFIHNFFFYIRSIFTIILYEFTAVTAELSSLTTELSSCIVSCARLIMFTSLTPFAADCHFEVFLMQRWA